MAYTFNRYENMLKDYLVDEASDAHNKMGDNQARYNNLKVLMNPGKIKAPHIIIRIGISEVIVAIEDGEIISGSIGADTKYIPKWLNKTGVRQELMQTWAGIEGMD